MLRGGIGLTIIMSTHCYGQLNLRVYLLGQLVTHFLKRFPCKHKNKLFILRRNGAKEERAKICQEGKLILSYQIFQVTVQLCFSFVHLWFEPRAFCMLPKESTIELYLYPVSSYDNEDNNKLTTAKFQ